MSSEASIHQLPNPLPPPSEKISPTATNTMTQSQNGDLNNAPQQHSKPTAPYRVDSDETIQNSPRSSISSSSGVSMARTRNTPPTPKAPDWMKGIQGSHVKVHDKPATQSRYLSGSVGVGGIRAYGDGKFPKPATPILQKETDLVPNGNTISESDVEVKSLTEDLSSLMNPTEVIASASEAASQQLPAPQQAKPVPPPTPQRNIFKSSLSAFPKKTEQFLDSFTTGNSSRPSSTGPKPKRTSSNTLEKINAFRASATDFFTNLTSGKKRGFSVDQQQRVSEENTGGEAIEEAASTSSGSTREAPKHMSTKDVGAAVVGSFQRIGSAISEKLSRVGTGGRSFVVRTPSFVATKGASPQQNQQEQYSPEPPKLPQIQYQSKVQQPEHIAKPKQTQKEKEDEERNSRHADVVGFLNGTKTLSAEFTENYKLGEVLGDGAFGFVMTATSLKDGKEVAVKFITRDKIPRDLWVKDPSNTNEKIPVEIAILQQISHPNIIKYIAHVVEPTKYILLITELHGTEWVSPPVQQPEDVDKAGSSTNIVAEKKRASSAGNAPPPTSTPLPKMECSPLFRLTPEQEKQIRRRTSCDLFECIDAHKRIPEPLAKKIFAQIALAVHFLHTNDLVHRDLKDENIVIDADYNIKLIDFGSAAHIPTQPKDYFTKFNGTTHFASPEIANHLAYRGPEAEMWSLGVLLYTIVFGENPFHNLTDILRGEYRIPFGLESDVQIEGCRHLIKRLLAYNPKERIKIDEVLKHAWLRDEVQQLQAKYDVPVATAAL